MAHSAVACAQGRPSHTVFAVGLHLEGTIRVPAHAAVQSLFPVCSACAPGCTGVKWPQEVALGGTRRAPQSAPLSLFLCLHLYFHQLKSLETHPTTTRSAAPLLLSSPARPYPCVMTVHCAPHIGVQLTINYTVQAVPRVARRIVIGMPRWPWALSLPHFHMQWMPSWNESAGGPSSSRQTPISGAKAQLCALYGLGGGQGNIPQADSNSLFCRV